METKELVRWCQSQGIVVTAYGSLGVDRSISAPNGQVAPPTKHVVRPSSYKGLAFTFQPRSWPKWPKSRGKAMRRWGTLGVLRMVSGSFWLQVLLRWALDQGVAVIPGTNSEEHIREDLDLNFRLAPEDVQLLVPRMASKSRLDGQESSAAPKYFTRWRNCRSGCA